MICLNTGPGINLSEAGTSLNRVILTNASISHHSYSVIIMFNIMLFVINSTPPMNEFIMIMNYINKCPGICIGLVCVCMLYN